MGLRERLIVSASYDALGIELAVGVDSALTEFAAWLRDMADNPADLWTLITPTVPGHISTGDDHRRAAFVLHRLADSITGSTDAD